LDGGNKIVNEYLCGAKLAGVCARQVGVPVLWKRDGHCVVVVYRWEDVGARAIGVGVQAMRFCHAMFANGVVGDVGDSFRCRGKQRR